jgi:hypothetical protein
VKMYDLQRCMTCEADAFFTCRAFLGPADWWACMLRPFLLRGGSSCKHGMKPRKQAAGRKELPGGSSTEGMHDGGAACSTPLPCPP